MSASVRRSVGRRFTDPAIVHAIMSKELEITMAYWGRVLDLINEHTLVLSTADDLGTQSGPLVSVTMSKDLIWPYHRRLFQFLKSRARTEEARRRIEDLAPGGGYVFAPIHVILAGVPPENIIAWWETLMEYGRYDET